MTYLNNRSYLPQGSDVCPIAFIIKINEQPCVIREELNFNLASSSERQVVIKNDTIVFIDDTTMYKVLDVCNHVSGTQIGGLPKKD